MRSTSQSGKSKKAGFLLRLAGLSLLIVALFMVGFFVMGPAIRKMTQNQDLKVQAPQNPSADTLSGPTSGSNPPVQVIERKLSPDRPRRETQKKTEDNSIKLEIEQPVSQPSAAEQPAEQAQTSAEPEQQTQEQQLYRVEVNGLSDQEAANRASETLTQKGYTPVVNKVITDSGTQYRVQVGAFRSRENADRVADDIRSQGLQVKVAGNEQ